MKTTRRLVGSVSIGLAVIALTADAETRYVRLDSPDPTPPYTNWLTAARTIQDAINAAAPDDQVLVTNGTYRPGSVRRSVVVLTNRVMVQSVNGPMVTVIDGSTNVWPFTGVGCAEVGNGSVLSGFTLTNGSQGV